MRAAAAKKWICHRDHVSHALLQNRPDVTGSVAWVSDWDVKAQVVTAFRKADPDPSAFQDCPKKLTRARMAGRLQNFRWRALLHDHALVEHQHPIRNI